MELYGGVDIGTTYSKCVILNSKGYIVGKRIEKTGIDQKTQAETILSDCLEDIKEDKKNIQKIALTGFGRRCTKSILSLQVMSYPEVICICKGVAYLGSREDGNGNRREAVGGGNVLILDIGGEKWKYIYSDGSATPKDFILNDLCAVGTGKFLDYVAKSMQLSMEDIIDKAMKSKKTVEINQICGIFVESEIISKLSLGEKDEELFAGLFQHMFNSIYTRASRLNSKSAVLYLTGGVSQNVFLQRLFGEKYERVIIPEEAQFICALGASYLLLPKTNIQTESKDD